MVPTSRVSTPPRYAIIPILICRNVVSVLLNMRMMMRQYIPRLWYDPYSLHARGLVLCHYLVRWSVICFQDSCTWFTVTKGALPEKYLSHNFDEHCLEDIRLIWCLSYPSGGAPLISGRYVSWWLKRLVVGIG